MVVDALDREQIEEAKDPVDLKRCLSFSGKDVTAGT